MRTKSKVLKMRREGTRSGEGRKRGLDERKGDEREGRGGKKRREIGGLAKKNGHL